MAALSTDSSADEDSYVSDGVSVADAISYATVGFSPRLGSGSRSWYLR